MVSTMKDNLQKRFSSLGTNRLVSQATLLDPRFKRYGFCNAKVADNAVELLKKELKGMKWDTGCVEIATTSTLSSPSSSSLWRDFDQAVTKLQTSRDNCAVGVLEANKYFEETLLDRSSDPLVWWEQRKCFYPTLIELVKKRLCIVATSVPCERVFSKAGQISTARRSSLKSSKFSEVIFLNHNLK